MSVAAASAFAMLARPEHPAHTVMPAAARAQRSVAKLVHRRQREFTAVSIVTIGAGVSMGLLDPGGWTGPAIAGIGFAAALVLAWDMPRVVPRANFHGQTTMQPPGDAHDSHWFSTLPSIAPAVP